VSDSLPLPCFLRVEGMRRRRFYRRSLKFALSSEWPEAGSPESGAELSSTCSFAWRVWFRLSSTLVSVSGGIPGFLFPSNQTGC